MLTCIKVAEPEGSELPCAFQGGTNAGLRAWGVGEIVSFGAAGKVKQVQLSVHACPQQPIAPLFSAVRFGGTTSVAVFIHAYRLNGSKSHHYLLLSVLKAQQLLLFLCMLTVSTAKVYCAPRYIHMLHQAYNQNDSIHSGLAAF